jgi:hypothetical protein
MRAVRESGRLGQPRSEGVRTGRRHAAWLRAVAVWSALTLAVAHPAEAQTRSFLWRATSAGGTVYLVGSVHMLTKDYYPLNPALDRAFKESDLLVEELDLGEMMKSESQLALLTRGLLTGGQTLDRVVSPRTYDLVSARVAALGLPLEPLKRFKPWSIALTLLALEWQSAGFDPALGLDKHFYDRAIAGGKAVVGLETVAYQIARFDEMPMPDQDRLLAQTLRELDTEKANVTALADAWRAGDVATIERIVLEDLRTDSLLYRRLLVERNAAWLPKITALFTRPMPSFVVVGAAHLVGPDGLIALLRAKGFHLEQQ